MDHEVEHNQMPKLGMFSNVLELDRWLEMSFQSPEKYWSSQRQKSGRIEQWRTATT